MPEGRVRGILGGSWSQCAVAEPWRLSMNLSVLPASCRQKGLLCRRDVGSTLRGAKSGSWSQCAIVNSRRLSKNRTVGRAVLCAPTAATTLPDSAKNGAHGVTRPTSAKWFIETMRDHRIMEASHELNAKGFSNRRNMTSGETKSAADRGRRRCIISSVAFRPQKSRCATSVVREVVSRSPDVSKFWPTDSA